MERLWIPLGLISYSFYLWHQPLIGRLQKVLQLVGLPPTKFWTFAIGFPVIFLAILALSSVLYLTIERGAILIKNWRSAPQPTGILPVNSETIG